MSAQLTSAYVMHQRPFRETSVLLDVFSQHFGRVSLIAKGVRKNKRSQSGLLQLYQPLLLSWTGRGDLNTLTAAEAESPRYNLQGQSALCGLYINELIVKLLPNHIAEPQVFMSYQQTLQRLQQSEDIEVALRLFEKCLLTQLGYGLVLDYDAETGARIDLAKRYLYQPDSGLYPYSGDDKQQSISGRSLHHLQTEQGFDKQSLAEVKQLMRNVIHFYLGGKPLHSRQLFASMKQYSN
jgi:DNA repair protein RecO (recombination protein O)